MKKIEELKNIIAAIEDDAVKCYTKGNKTAGIRIRKAMQEIKKKAQEIRDEISALKND